MKVCPSIDHDDDLPVEIRVHSGVSCRVAPGCTALFAYGHDVRGDWRKAASLVDKILRGAKAGDLPFEQPSTLELLVNLKAASAIGLSVPDSMIAEASRVKR